MKTIILATSALAMSARSQPVAKETFTRSPIDTVNIYFQSLAKGDYARLGSVLDDNVVWHQPGHGTLSGTYQGKDTVFALFGKFMEISQGSFKIDGVSSIMNNGDFVAASIHFAAQKPGSSISMDGVDLMRVKDEKITEVFLFSSDQAAEDAFWN